MNSFSHARKSSQIQSASTHGTLLRCSEFSRLILIAGILAWAASPGVSVFGATPASEPAASATSIMGKEAKLNGTPMPVGATLFPGDVIRLGEASTAALRFGDSTVLVASLSELVVESEGVSLRNGRLQVRSGGAKSFAVSGPFFRVNIAAYGIVPSSAEIRLAGMRAQISAVAGAADLTAEGNLTPYRLNAGETANLDATGAD